MVTLGALMSTLLLLAGCGETEVAAPAPPQAPVVKEAPTRTAAAQASNYDDDGVLKPASEQAFGTPVPMSAQAVATDKGFAAFVPRHSYKDLKNFFEKHAGENYNVESKPGGLRLTPKDGTGTRIYVNKPRRVGERARVLYFGDGDAASIPKALRNQNVNAPTEPTGEAAKGQAPTSPRVEGTGGALRETEKKVIYRQKEFKDGAGRRVVVWEPRDPAEETGRERPKSEERSNKRAKERKSVGRAYRKVSAVQ